LAAIKKQRRANAADQSGNSLKICLAASGGGHARQLLDLEPVWVKHRYFFVTESTALGQTLAKDYPVYFLPHFAWGQARQGSVWTMMSRAIQSFFRSATIILRERPDVLISTGAGAVFFVVLWARLLGTRVIVAESFARFDKPSLFGRIAAPFANHLIAQSAKLGPYYPRAKIFDPLRILETGPVEKEPLLFATVGATLPFDRLVNSVAELKTEGVISESVIAQTGIGGVSPPGLQVVETLAFDEVQDLLKRASIVVCHGGTGSLITALRAGCHVIAMPRLPALHEHYDNHQSEITEAFASRGLISVANSVDELREAIGNRRNAPRIFATTDQTEMIAYLEGILSSVPALAARR
jgi:UDP-N-acetylglucosamine transferase subunit ALG13